MSLPFNYTCLYCSKKVFVQARDRDEAQKFAAKDGWVFDLGPGLAVCSQECFTDFHRKRQQAHEAGE